jgi:hypothetical protein
MGRAVDPAERERWNAALRAKSAGKPQGALGRQVSGKGIGPNKACGHKGGICRQGSKRG